MGMRTLPGLLCTANAVSIRIPPSCLVELNLKCARNGALASLTAKTDEQSRRACRQVARKTVLTGSEADTGAAGGNRKISRKQEPNAEEEPHTHESRWEMERAPPSCSNESFGGLAADQGGTQTGSFPQ